MIGLLHSPARTAANCWSSLRQTATMRAIACSATATALLPPWLLGYMADAWGVGVVMALPLVGTMMVFLLVLLIWLESKIGG